MISCDVHNYDVHFSFTACSHYKATKPSWRELEYFNLFLSAQLSAFEHSEFCDTGYMSRALPGMRSLVMKMIMQMSKVQALK